MSVFSPTTEPEPVDSGKLLRWVGAIIGVAAIVAVAIAVWPASEADKAHDDGKQLGAAVTQLYNAQSWDEVQDARVEVRTALDDTRTHAGDAVADQADSQVDALDRTVDGYVGAHTSDDSFEADLYQAELDTAVDDLSYNADNFTDNAPDVVSSFWNGFDEGLTVNN